MQGFVKLSNGFRLIDSFKTLQAFDFSADCLGDGVGEFGLATTRWSLKQDGFIQPGREVYDRGGHPVGEVPNRVKSFLRLLWAVKQLSPPPASAPARPPNK